MLIKRISGEIQKRGILHQVPISVALTDDNNVPLEGEVVEFSIDSYPYSATYQSLSLPSGSTDSNGKVSVYFDVGEVGGEYLISALAQSLPSDPLTFNVLGIALISLQDVKSYMKRDLNSTEDDKLFATWIGDLSLEIESRVGQAIMPRVVTEYLSGSGGSKMYLKNRIISLYTDVASGSVVSLQYKDTFDSDWENLCDSESQIYLDQDDAFAITLLDDKYFPRGVRNIKVVYNAGIDPIPGDIRKMVMEMIQIMWDESKKGGNPRLGFQNKNVGMTQGSTGDTYLEMDDIRWKKVINRYKRLT